MSDEKVLTKEIAEQWVKDVNSSKLELNEFTTMLNEFTTMEEAAAQSLLGTHGW